VIIMTMSNTAPAKVGSATKRNQALNLRIKGFTLSAIGEKLGISKSRAFQYVSEGLAKLNQVAVVEAEELRRLTCEQIDQLLAAHMPAALQGDTKAAGVVLRALDSRAKLFGLVKPQVAQAAQAPSRYEQMSPEELRAEARKLGIYPADRPDSPSPYATPTAPSPGTNGTTPSPWRR
jgi:hypothetical protein